MPSLAGTFSLMNRATTCWGPRGLVESGHAKNFKESPDGWISDVALDEGVNDVRAMLAKVKASGYDDWISLEFGGPTREKVRRSAKFVRTAWASLPKPS
jgi:sugar phosphate isomerase/epimerase